MPLSLDGLSVEILKLVEQAGVSDGIIYLQLTRGAARRNHIYPEDLAPTLLFYTRSTPNLPPPGEMAGLRLLSVADERWKKCWIKSIALLPNVLAKSQAHSAGADEALFVDDGVATECSASNFFAVADDQVLTHPVGPKVLPGITRAALLGVAQKIGVNIVERPILLSELPQVAEIFITGTTREVSWVSHLDDRQIAERIGPVTLRLAEAFREHIAAVLATSTSDHRPADRPRLAFGCR